MGFVLDLIFRNFLSGRVLHVLHVMPALSSIRQQAIHMQTFSLNWNLKQQKLELNFLIRQNRSSHILPYLMAFIWRRKSVYRLSVLS